jgi:hypothetical protein
MTAVARLAIRNHPTLIGDLLISGDEVPGFSPALPTRKDVSSHFPQGADIVPVATGQKIVLVTDQLVVGWAGDCDITRDVICELQRKSAITPFTMASLDQHLDTLSPSVWDEISLVGFIREPKGIAQFQRDAKEVDTKLFGTVALIGSGRTDMESFLTSFQQLPDGMDRKLNELEQSLGFALHLTGTFLNLEQLTAESIVKYYGAGYEIASLMGENFEKMGNVTYIFWTALAHDGKPRLNKHPTRLFRYAYIADLLVVRAFTFEPSVTTRDELHFVTPVYRDGTAEEQSWVDHPETAPAPSLDAPWLCNYIVTTLPNGKSGILTLACLKAPGEDKWVKITETPVAGGAYVEVQVSQEFIDIVGREVGKQLKTLS